MATPERIEGSWGVEPVPDRLRVLGTLDTGLLWGNLGVSLLVIVAGAALVPALSLPDALVAILVGCVIGNAHARRRRRDRGRCARAGHGADAGAARPARLVPPDRRERAPGDRLVGVRAAHHRDGRRRALGRALRLPRAVAVDARLRRIRAPPRVARPDRLRSALRPPNRRLGGAVRAPLPDLVGARRRRSGCALGHAWRRRALGLAGSRHRRRDHGLLGPARGGLHALLVESTRRRPGDGARLLRSRYVAARTRRRSRPLS